MLIDSGVIDMYIISRINVVVGGDHETLYMINNGKRHESIQPLG